MFTSVNDFEPTAVAAHSGTRPNMILLDGGDLMAVLDERLELPALLLRKRRHAARTGEVFIPAWRLLS